MVETLVDFGLQPPSNRFLEPDSVDEARHELSMGQCPRCGLLQLIAPMPPSMVKPRFSWITYSEPERHLDAAVERLSKLPGLTPASAIRGLTYLDDTTLDRFRRLGHRAVSRFDERHDLDLPDECAGLETIQGQLTAERVRHLLNTHGPAKLLLVRYVLEHAHQPQLFLQALGQLVAPDGYVVVEVPACAKFVEACDYSFVWEEHITYFSRATLTTLATLAGFEVADVVSYPYPLEDSLMFALRRRKEVPMRSIAAGEEELAQGAAFKRRFPEIREFVRQRLAAVIHAGKRVAVFGAGHTAATFLNVFDLTALVECVIDDNPNKQRLRMPGSGLPIVGSEELITRPIDLCILSLSPESEEKVLAKSSSYLERGGQFASIFALSPISLMRQI
jgi:hypothetical protein